MWKMQVVNPAKNFPKYLKKKLTENKAPQKCATFSLFMLTYIDGSRAVPVSTVV